MKPKLLTAVNHATMLNLGCDCGLCFSNTSEARIVKKRGRPKKPAPIKVWFVGRIYKIHRECGNGWVEYRGPIDLMDRPSNMAYVGIKKEPTVSGLTIL